MKPVLIVENSTTSLIRESVGSTKKDYVMGGIFTEFGIKNRNDRVYTAEKYLPALEELNERITTMGVVYGEFGRTPFGQNQQGPKVGGRDHFGRAYSWWLAGGGVKRGHVYGETDEFGWNVAKDSVHIHDMQATLLHLCGINHEALTFRYQGRQFRLTDVHGKLVNGLLG